LHFLKLGKFTLCLKLYFQSLKLFGRLFNNNFLASFGNDTLMAIEVNGFLFEKGVVTELACDWLVEKEMEFLV
jgi:hypothetical protein